MSAKRPIIEVDPELLEEALDSVDRKEGPAKEKVREGCGPAESEEVRASEAPESEEDLKDRYLRLAADYDNYRKRMSKERSEFLRYANENLVRELLPVLDNFERAFGHARDAENVEAIRKGVELIFSQILGILERFGVRSESAAGKIFDPLIHEAVSHVPSQERPAHHVIEELQKAYFLHDRLVRPAMVVVSKGPAEEAEKEQEDDGGEGAGE